MNEVDKFFNDIPKESQKEADIFDDKPKQAPEKEVAKTEDEDEPVKKNRAYRRLEEKYQKEREASIALNARIQALSEMDQYKKEVAGEIDADLAETFGPTEDGKRLAKFFQNKFDSLTEKAKEEALREIEQRVESEKTEVSEYENFIDSQLEALEDTYNVDLTSDSPTASKARSEFLQMVLSVSPKDEDGVLKDYADFGSTFEMFQNMKQSQNKPDATRNKELASRSMQKSGQGGQTETQKITPGFRGWMKDMNIDSMN